jgi:16S rRNA (guanine(966)-N(2))-methyltransferase RsmD
MAFKSKSGFSMPQVSQGRYFVIEFKLAGESMRVIAGSKRGMKLETLDGLETRPTADRVKEALFNLIQFEIRGAQVLDLFGGSGALGIEALSRGAEHAVFVDQNRASVQMITRNLEKTQFTGQARVIATDWQAGLSRLEDSAFDLVLIDPPYHANLEIEVLERLELLNLLSSEAVVVIEHPAFRVLPEQVYGYTYIKSKQYGKTALTLYRRQINDKSNLPG